MEELWVDNDVFNYLCKASCLQEVLQSVPYTLCTTELVQGEAEAASSVLYQLRSQSSQLPPSVGSPRFARGT